MKVRKREEERERDGHYKCDKELITTSVQYENDKYLKILEQNGH
jgi:hypothetical protein